MLFGGSWGSTLCVAYAETHPERVLAMVLRGIFLSRQVEIEWLYENRGAAMLYPEAFAAYMDGLPKRVRGAGGRIMDRFYELLCGEGDTEERRVAANAWSWWEHCLSTFPVRGGETGGGEYSDEENLAFARLECHYFMNAGFFAEDGFLLKENQIRKIRHIKTYIVQGRWDMVCPRKTAYDLKEGIGENAEIVIVDNSGHSAFEPAIEKELLKFTDRVARDLSAP